MYLENDLLSINHSWEEEVAYVLQFLGARDKRHINSAMDEWKRYTCIDFKPATSDSKYFIKYVDGQG